MSKTTGIDWEKHFPSNILNEFTRSIIERAAQIALSRQSVNEGDWEKELEVHTAVEISDRYQEYEIGDVEYVRLDEVRTLFATRTPEGSVLGELQMLKGKAMQMGTDGPRMCDIDEAIERHLSTPPPRPTAPEGQYKPGSPAFELGKWMSAALDDPGVCDEMKQDIHKWFAAGCPTPPPRPTATGGITEADLDRVFKDVTGQYPLSSDWNVANEMHQQLLALIGEQETGRECVRIQKIDEGHVTWNEWDGYVLAYEGHRTRPSWAAPEPWISGETKAYWIEAPTHPNHGEQP